MFGTDPGVQVSKASFKGRLCSCGFFCTCSRKKRQPVPLLPQDGSSEPKGRFCLSQWESCQNRDGRASGSHLLGLTCGRAQWTEEVCAEVRMTWVGGKASQEVQL